MSSVVVLGAQWGDEGKGKIVDYLAQKADAVVRYSGGSNAGHTVVVNNINYKLRLLPSGVLFNDKTNVLGNGVVINPGVVLAEIAGMKEKGIDCSNLVISDRAHVVLPYHQRLDELQEEALGNHKIGTTKGGIGPCYMDKVARVGIRICDLMEPETFADKLKVNLEAKNAIITKIYGAEPFDYDTVLKEYLAYAEELRPYVPIPALLWMSCSASAKTFCLKAHRLPSSISTMVPIRMLPAPTRLQVMPAPAVA